MQVSEINSTDKYACSNCWPKIETFHDFYVMVETSYRNILNDIDSKISINPLFDCEPEIIVNETACVKTEIDRLDAYVPDDRTIYVPTTSYWDDVPKATTNKGRISQSLKEFVSVDCQKESKKWRKAANKSGQHHSKRTKIMKTKSNKQKHPKNAWKLPSNVEKIMQVQPKLISQNEQTFNSISLSVRCYICKKQFSTFPNLRRHFHLHDSLSDFVFECHQCGKKFSSKLIKICNAMAIPIHLPYVLGKIVLRDHLKYHEARKTYDKNLDIGYEKVQCPVCSKQ